MPADVPGEVKKVGQEEYRISGLSSEQLYRTVLKLREETGVKLGGQVGEGRDTLTDVSLSSSLQDLSQAYRKLRGIS